jgi:hypothetical protein
MGTRRGDGVVQQLQRGSAVLLLAAAAWTGCGVGVAGRRVVRLPIMVKGSMSRPPWPAAMTRMAGRIMDAAGLASWGLWLDDVGAGARHGAHGFPRGTNGGGGGDMA